MRSYFWMLVQNISGVQRCALFLARIYQGCCRECNLVYTILWSSWTWFNHENKSLTLNTWAQQQLLSKKKEEKKKRGLLSVPHWLLSYVDKVLLPNHMLQIWLYIFRGSFRGCEITYPQSGFDHQWKVLLWQRNLILKGLSVFRWEEPGINLHDNQTSESHEAFEIFFI